MSRPSIPRSELRTKFAGAASALADAFADRFEATRLASARVELRDPDVVSTAGGAQATQHLRLVFTDERVLILGSANAKAGSVELRTYEYAQMVHKERFGDIASMTRAEYDAFLEQAATFFQQQGLVVERTGPPSLPPPPQGAFGEAGGGRSSTWLLLAVLLALVGGAVAYFLARK